MAIKINYNTKLSSREQRGINETLPVEMHINVLEFLNKQDSANARGTQHLWAQLTPPVMERSLNLSNSNVDDETLKGIIHAYKRKEGKLVSINLSNCPGITDIGIRYITESHIPLTELILTGCCITDQSIGYLARARLPLTKLDIELKPSCGHITDTALKYLAKARIPLTSLNISETQITDAGLKYLNTIPLTELTLRNGDITDKGIKRLADARLSLTKLNLAESRRFQLNMDQVIKYLADAHIPLTSLDVSYSNITEIGIKYLMAFPLKELILYHCDPIWYHPMKSMQYLSHLPLNKLTISSSIKMNNKTALYLSKLKHITHLNLECCDIRPNHLRHLSHLHLTHLNLGYNPHILDQDLEYIADLPLESLSLRYCHGITPEGLDLLASSFHLKTLDLRELDEPISAHARAQQWLIPVPSSDNSQFQHRLSWLSSAATEVRDSNVWHFNKPSARNIVDRDLNNLVLDYL